MEGKIDELKGELFSLTGDINFKKALNMGAVLQGIDLSGATTKRKTCLW